MLYKADGHEFAKRSYWRDKRDRIEAWKRGTEGQANDLNLMEDSKGDRYQYDDEGQLTHAFYRVGLPEGDVSPHRGSTTFSTATKMGSRMGWNTSPAAVIRG